MENSSSEQVTPSKAPMSLIVTIIVIVIIMVVAWQYTGEKPLPTPVADKPAIKKEIEAPKVVIDEPEPEIIEPVEIIIEPEVIENPLPELSESDAWLQEKLPTLTWRKELLNLVIDDDMIRRFVVFTDNFAQGTIAYEHSPFVLPSAPFSVAGEDNAASSTAQTTWQWNEKATRRFSLYVDLLRSFDSETLIQWYMEVKPLIDEAYAELGYPDDDFTDTLQDAITRVLDMELPKISMSLVRPSVMYRFQSPELEGLDETDKLLLRLGKENLLVIKSVLLELNEKLAQEKNGIK